MATFPSTRSVARPLPAPASLTSCEFSQLLMKVQRATHLIASTLDLDALLDRVVNDIASNIGNVEVGVWLRAENSEQMVLQGVRGCTRYCKGTQMRLGPEQGTVGYAATTGQMHYAPDVRLDPYYIGCEEATRSEAVFPLIANGRVTGVMCVDHRDLDAFSEDQLAVLQAIAGHLAIALENARTFGLERRERARLEKESADARAMQQEIFFRPTPLVPNFSFETAWHPAGAVAGDWFDFIDLGGGRWGIALADVSGKGMPAALLMAATRALLRSIAPQHAAPGEVLKHLNRSLIEDFPCGKFVTMIYAVLDAATRTMTVASAGHPRPLLVQGDCTFLDVETGLPLGLADSPYPEQTITLPAGTSVLLYTDGITEAVNEADEDYGPARLLQHFSHPDACVEGLIAEVKSFGVRQEYTDDATAVLIRSR